MFYFIPLVHLCLLLLSFSFSNHGFFPISVKKQKRKLSICYNVLHVLDKLEDTATDTLTTLDKDPDGKESNVMLKITDKLAKMWSSDGYRDCLNISAPTLRVTNPKLTAAAASSTDSKKNGTVSLAALSASTESTTALSSEEVDLSENPTNQVSSQTCARQAMYDYCDSSVTELAAYLDETLFIPRKMSFMAEMMYT